MIEQNRLPFEKCFFASSNSSKGFNNDYPRCFGEDSGIQRLYVIKGGPGTGKSHFLKTVGRYAESVGYQTTYYHCSSDPSSLDGLRIEGEGKPCIGFLDGTAPHVWEPTAIGVREEIINLGIFWDSERLRSQKQKIMNLSAQKSQCYERAYAYLNACGSVSSVTEGLVKDCIKQNKLEALAKRLLVSLEEGQRFREIPAHLRSVGMSGCHFFHTYEEMAHQMGGEVIGIDECYGVGYALTEALWRRSIQKKLTVMVSRNPIHIQKIDGLFYPDTGLCLLVADDETVTRPHRRITLQRYLEQEKFRSIRGEVRHHTKIANALKESACRSLASAGKFHFALESIYAAAMDFKAKEAFDQSFCRRTIVP